MRRMSAALKADWNVSIIRRKLLQANARLEAFALQIEADIKKVQSDAG